MKSRGIEGGTAGSLVGQEQNQGDARRVTGRRSIRARRMRRDAGEHDRRGETTQPTARHGAQNRLPRAFRTAFLETSYKLADSPPKSFFQKEDPSTWTWERQIRLPVSVSAMLNTAVTP